MLTPAEFTPAMLAEAGITALPPTQAELPYDDGEPMESQRHRCQMELLIQALIPWLDAREDGFVGGNVFAKSPDSRSIPSPSCSEPIQNFGIHPIARFVIGTMSCIGNFDQSQI